jgi:hypothetical protein
MASAQAKEAFLDAAVQGDLATLTRLMNEGVSVYTTNAVSCAPIAATTLGYRPRPTALAALAALSAPCTLPRLAAHRVWHRRRAVARSPCLHRGATPPSCWRLVPASSAASTT